MATNKTSENTGDVLAYLETITNEKRKADALVMLDIMSEITGKKPTMWGNSIVGFGKYRYKYESGREGEWFICGFSPRVQALTLYLMQGYGSYEAYMEKLGNYKTGKSCLYIKKLEDIDMKVLKALIGEMVKDISKGGEIIG